jgi:dihydrofolate synthase/folylpolyglutamate synthase
VRNEVRFLDSLQGRGIRPGLERMRTFLKLVGNPQKAVPSVIVAGTNGKGSTAATIASILQTSGYRTGFYTSPHLVTLLERWRIDGRDLPEEQFVEKVRMLRRLMTRHSIELTYFEALTALAFLTFAESECDVSVLEVGMGGRLDATNVTRPLVAAITPIGLDHTEYLGPTIRRIAREKSGVIHRGTSAVTSNRDRAVIDVLRRRCRDIGATLRLSWRSARASKVESSLDGIRFQLESPSARYKIHSPLPGLHQVDNISAAVCAAEELQRSFSAISKKSIERGVAATRWRGRLEHFTLQGRDIIVDGAHNGHAAVRLAQFIRRFVPEPRSLVFGVMKDKDVTEIARQIVPLFDEVIVTEPDPERAARTGELEELLRSYGVRVTARPKPQDALRAALKGSDRAVVIAGSLYLAGDAVAFLDRAGARSTQR